MKLEEFNQLDQIQAEEILQTCCGSSRWRREMEEQRPFSTVENLKKVATEIWNNCQQEDWKEAFSHHPKIGDLKSLEEKFRKIKHFAEKEQGGVDSKDSRILQELAKGNMAYEVKYGYIFIVCATGKSAKEMLKILKSRIHNSPEEEIIIAKDEEAKITALRLDKLFA